MYRLKLGLLLVGYCITYCRAVKSTWQIPEEYKEPAKMLHNMCLKESGASEELIRTCMDGTIHEDRGVQCYIHCLFDKLMVINEDTGHIHLDRLAKIAPNTDMKEAFEFLHKECGHILTEDHCLTAFQAAKCYFDSHDEVVKFCHLLVADLGI